ncbi:carboxypeptidase-like regulatory domain-containing protein [Paenarthrobacter sp. RAF9]
MRGISRGRFRLALALLGALFLGALPAGFASPAFAAATGSISGTVTVPEGFDVTKIAVQTLSPSYSYAQVQANGTFSLTGLDAGQYKVRFSAFETPELISTWYGGYKESQATVVPVAAGAAVTGINQTLTVGGKISGTVTVPAGVDVTKVDAATSAGSRANPAADGSYTIAGLPTGTYDVAFSYTFESAPVLGAPYSTSPDGAATPVSVTEGATTSGISQTLKPAVVISGKISVPAGAPAFNGQVMVETGPDFTRNDYAGSDLINPSDLGTFAIGGLKAGTYKLHYRANDDQWANMWHNGVTAAGSSPWITVTDGQKLQGIQDNAVAAATISGSVAGAPAPGSSMSGPGMSITAVTPDGAVASNTVMETSQTTFALKNLLPGSYKVQFNRTNGNWTTYEGQLYKDLPESGGAGNATLVTVGAGQTNARSVATAVGRNTDLGTLSYATASQGTRGFDDVPLGAQFQDEIQWLADKGISTGWEANGSRTYQPLSPVNRDAMAAFMYRLAGKPAFTAPVVTPFKDLPVGTQFYKEITWLADKGISTGWVEADKSTTYRPLQAVNRDAMAAFMYRLAGEPEFTAPKVSPFVDVPVGAQFYKEITWLAAQGISTGWAEAGNTKSFHPLQPVNRDAMAAFMFRYNTKFGAK